MYKGHYAFPLHKSSELLDNISNVDLARKIFYRHKHLCMYVWKNWHQMMNLLMNWIQWHFQDYYNESKVKNLKLHFQILLSLINLVFLSMRFTELNSWYFLSKNNTTSLNLCLRDFQMRFFKNRGPIYQSMSCFQINFLSSKYLFTISGQKKSPSYLPSILDTLLSTDHMYDSSMLFFKTVINLESCTILFVIHTYHKVTRKWLLWN